MKRFAVGRQARPLDRHTRYPIVRVIVFFSSNFPPACHFPKIFLRKFTYRIFKTQCWENFPRISYASLDDLFLGNVAKSEIGLRKFLPKSQNILCFFPDFKNFLPNAQNRKFSCETVRQKIYILRLGDWNRGNVRIPAFSSLELHLQLNCVQELNDHPTHFWG